MIILVPTLYAILVGLVIFAAGAGVGRLVLQCLRARFQTPLELHCIALGLGMGILSHATLLLGLAGGWRANGFAILAVLFLLAATAGYLSRTVALRLRLWATPQTPIEVLALIALALAVFCVGLRAIPPPANYDVLEYHLGAVQHWLREGRIVAFPRLFYAALPFEVEMWYALGCFAEGNPLLPAVPKWINFGVYVSNIAAVYAISAVGCRERALRLLACLLFAIHPISLKTAADALNDQGVAWYSALAVLAWLRWFERNEQRFFYLWAIFLGLAVCCKYTAAGLVVFPAAAVLLGAGCVRGWGGYGRDGQNGRGGRYGWSGPVISFFLFFLMVGVVFGPWAAKNAVHHGNPVYPLLARWFPTENWSPEQTDFYMAAHGRTNPGEATYWRSVLKNLTGMGWWLAAVLGLGLWTRRRDMAYHCLIVAWVLGLLVHSVFPKNPDRFMLVFLPTAAALAAWAIEGIPGSGKPWRACAAAPFVLWIGTALLGLFNPAKGEVPASAVGRIGFPTAAEGPSAPALAMHLFSTTPRLEVLEWALGPDVVASQRFVNERTTPDARIFLLYEARIGCFERRVSVGSVFDRSPLADYAAGMESSSQLLGRLQEEGFDYLYVNEFELRRIVGTYTPRTLPSLEPLLEAAAGDIREARRLAPFYPPFQQDPRLDPKTMTVILEFIELCRRHAVFELRPGVPYGLWIAPLKEPAENR